MQLTSLISQRPHSNTNTPSTPVEAGDLLVQYLEQLGVDYVFGVPGGAIEPLFNALGRSARRGSVRPIVARHEFGAVAMADAYARETGKIGVCCATTGPGATNCLTAIASAYQDGIPLLLITAQTPITTFGRGAVQESSCTAVDTVGIFKHCTRYSSLVSHIDQFEQKLTTAIMTASQGIKGPAHLSVPLDVFRTEAPVPAPSYDIRQTLRVSGTVDELALDETVRLLCDANKVGILVGSRCNGSIGPIVAFAERIGADLATTPQGKGLVSAYHPLYKGVFGLAGHDSAYRAFADEAVDVVLAVGTSLDEQATRCWDEIALMNDRMIHIDSSDQVFSRSPMAQCHLAGDIRTVFLRLLHRMDALLGPARTHAQMAHRRGNTPPDYALPEQVHIADRDKCLADATPIKPQRLMFELARRLPPNTRYLADIGNSFLWVIHHLHPRERRISGERTPVGGSVRTSMGFASMGWAIGGAVGTAAGCPGEPVVCVTGDGSFLMNGQEISVAVQEGLPVLFVVLNDTSLGTVKHGQRLAGAERIGFQLPEVDFAAMARAMGADAHTVRSPKDLDRIDFDTVWRGTRPTLLNVLIDPEEVPPMRMRMTSLGTGVES